MGNPQVTESDLSWLAGIIDGEGCFTMSPGSRGSYNMSIKIVNTNKRIIEEVCDILTRAELPYHRYNAWRSANQRAAERIEINGPKRVEKALKVLLPYIRGKSDEAHLMQEYIEKRLSTPYGEMDPVYQQFVYKQMRALKR